MRMHPRVLRRCVPVESHENNGSEKSLGTSNACDLPVSTGAKRRATLLSFDRNFISQVIPIGIQIKLCFAVGSNATNCSAFCKSFCGAMVTLEDCCSDSHFLKTAVLILISWRLLFWFSFQEDSVSRDSGLSTTNCQSDFGLLNLGPFCLLILCYQFAKSLNSFQSLLSLSHPLVLVPFFQSSLLRL
jgi:hypothetical protein